jgi:hypothetical protein
MEIVSEVQCFSYTELPTRDLIGPESDDSDRMTGNPEVIDSSAGLVPRNALVMTGLA